VVAAKSELVTGLEVMCFGKLSVMASSLGPMVMLGMAIACSSL